MLYRQVKWYITVCGKMAFDTGCIYNTYKLQD